MNSYTFIIIFLDINECEDITLCQNNGTCSNTDGSYVCSCVEGWQGHNCEKGAKFNQLKTDMNICLLLVLFKKCPNDNLFV